MNISVCITTFNEESSIERLLDSLLNQTIKPDEIIIVDGGSKDKTCQIIKHYQKKDKRIKLLIEPGSIAHGRNISIEIAKGDIITLTDAGCIAKKDWLEKITHPFIYKNVGLVAGFYEMSARNEMNEAINVFHGIPPERFDSTNFIPSARSVAFKKQVWSEIGGFDEKLDRAGEDTKFFYEVVNRGVKIVRVKEARVEWEEIGNLSFKSSLKKLYYYAKGDAQTGIWLHSSKHIVSHNIKITFILFRYIVGFILLIVAFKYNWLFSCLIIGLFLYLIWSIWKWRDIIKNWKVKLWLPIIQVSSDFAVMAGFMSAFIRKK